MLPKPLSKLIFIDLETVPQYPTFESLPEDLKKHFRKKFQPELDKLSTARDLTAPVTWETVYAAKAPLQAEWNKIVCISAGRFSVSSPGMILANRDIGDFDLKTESFYGEDEKEILKGFHKGYLDELEETLPQHLFVAHAGLTFDFPVLAKRYILNLLKLPKKLDFVGIKPWELDDRFIDTLGVWKMTTFDAGISLDMLASSFGVASSKTDMDGSMVADEYWNKKNFKGIAQYCEEDVRCLAEVYLRLKGMTNKVNMQSKFAD